MQIEKTCNGEPYVPPPPTTAGPTQAPPTEPPALEQNCDDLIHYT